MAPSPATLAKAAAKVEEDTLFSAKRHFISCQWWNRAHYGLGIPIVIVAALSATVASGHHDAWAVGLATTAAILAGLATFLNPHQRAAAHAAAGNRYQAVRNRAHHFRNVRCIDPERSPADLETELESLAADRDKLNEESPSTPWFAFRLARRGIEQGEAEYAVDAAPPSA